MGFAFPLLCIFLMRACDGTKAPTLYFIQNGTKDAKRVGAIPTSHHLLRFAMEQICFSIPYGDTADPNTIAKQLAEELQFKVWMITKKDDPILVDPTPCTVFLLSGWTTDF